MRYFVTLAVVVSVSAVAVLFAAEPAKQVEARKDETTPSGLQIKFVAPGDAGAKDGDTVAVLYTGKLKDGTEFDSSAKHGGDPIEFILGKGMVIKGWDEGIAGMQIGEKRTLVIPPAIAYGEAGSPPVIPPNATLTFDVQLLGIRRPAAQPEK